MSECRICKESVNEPSNPLISPCNCTGSIGKVHNNCIESWVQSSSNNNICNICNTPFFHRIEYDGPISQSFIAYITAKNVTIKTLLAGIWLLFNTGIICRSSFGTLWNYFILSPLTFSRLATYNVFSYSSFACIGFVVGLLRQYNFQYNNQEIQIDGNMVLLPITNLFTIMEFLIATHHTTYTGWVLPVILMYYMSLYRLCSTIIFDDFLGWYKTQYFRRVFTNAY